MPDTQRVNMAIKHSADPSLDKLSYVSIKLIILETCLCKIEALGN